MLVSKLLFVFVSRGLQPRFSMLVAIHSQYLAVFVSFSQ